MFSTKERSAWEKLWITERKNPVFVYRSGAGWEILLTVEKQEESEKSKTPLKCLKRYQQRW